MSDYKTVRDYAAAEFIEKKSRFIGYVTPVTTEQQAMDFISQIKSKHYDATHNVYAYILRDNHIQRYSDDGEPSGTAGVPTLEVLRKEGLTDACVVVTRYFGGTLLGAGGLVRAYTKAAKLGVDAAGILQRRLCHPCTVNIDYTLLGKVQNELANTDCILGDTKYENDVTLTLYIPHTETGITDRLIDITNGRAIIKKSNEEIYVDAN